MAYPTFDSFQDEDGTIYKIVDIVYQTLLGDFLLQFADGQELFVPHDRAKPGSSAFADTLQEVLASLDLGGTAYLGNTAEAWRQTGRITAHFTAVLSRSTLIAVAWRDVADRCN